jgi:predicted acyl esterase
MSQRTEKTKTMRIDWDVPILMSDGTVLRADVYRPLALGRYPILLTYGPYAKGLSFQEGYPDQWKAMVTEHPEVTAGSVGKYQSWEVVDPEKWVPDGYACVRVDGRGAGRSPGFLDPVSPQENRDYYECIEWAGTQNWSNGKVGLNGISYYAWNQWHVASLQPPHLAAMCPWEGAADWYRDMTHHGGILSTFFATWYPEQILTVQHGMGENAPRNPNTGELVAGPETLADDELIRNRVDLGRQVLEHPLDDEHARGRSPDWSRVTVPFLSCASWGGQGLHPRGNFEAFVRAASKEKWLEGHGLEHWTHFYTDYGRLLQKRFFDYYLKGEDNGWNEQPPVLLQVRHPGERFVERTEQEWPLARTQWTKFYLDAAGEALTTEPPAESSASYAPLTSDGITFWTPPLEQETEITGPVAVRVALSSATTDADLFLVLRVFDPQGEEVLFAGTLDPHTPVGQGWLRASHRKLDTALTLPYRPYHTHDEVQPLVPGDRYDVDVEVWPTCIVVPAGYRIALTVRGTDFDYGGEPINVGWFVMKGSGAFNHDDPTDRPREIFGGTVTLHTGGGEDAPHLLLPVIPAGGGSGYSVA